MINFELLHANAVLPMRHSFGAAGFDLPLVDDLYLSAGQRLLVPLGVAVSIPTGYQDEIRARFSTTVKHGIDVFVDTINSDYCGQLHAFLINSNDRDLYFEHGTRLVQLVVTPVYTTSSADVAAYLRSNNGFGSTGK